jgi:parallel beta-helix repeat protein
MGGRRADLVVSVWMASVVLVAVFGVALNVPVVRASGTIYIRADGSVEGTDKIVTADNVTYTFIDNITDSIVVERNNIVLDGAGYTVQSSGIGIDLPGRSNATIKNTNIDGSFGGYGGIRLYESSDNSIVGNNITANSWYGIVLYESSNNMLRNNRMVDNGVNFGVVGSTLSDFINDVDTSNTVDGKPIYYWVNKQGMAVPLDAGYVALVNCTGIRVQNLNFTRNWQGLLLAATINSTISENNITKNQGSSTEGLLLWCSSNNTISENNITKNGENGMELYESSNNTIILNNITNNGRFGIYLYESSNNTISGNNITATYGYADSKGVLLEKSSNNVINGNIVTKNDYEGIVLAGSSNNMIIMNNITDNGDWGIDLTYLWPGYYSDNNTIIGNNVTKNFNGIRLRLSWYNTLNANTVTNNRGKGLHMETASQNILRDNILVDNEYSFGVFTFYDEVRLSTYTQDIDTSNTVNGKPIYYLINQTDLLVDLSDIGYLALINCTNVRIKGVSLTNNGQGLLLAFTTNSTIENVTIANNNVGIHVLSSDANLITASTVTNNAFGISLYRSSHNNITKNTLTNNGYGSGFHYGCVLIGRLVMGEGVQETTETIPSEDNIISSTMISNNGGGIILSNPGTTRTIINGNTISNNGDGIYIEYGASSNRFFHNNFKNNTHQVHSDGSANIWDNDYPSGGNFWSDYTGVDMKSGPCQNETGSDGVADALYEIDENNIDRYPLMAPFNTFDAGTWNGVSYSFDIISNSTISDFRFNPDEGALLRFNVTGENGTSGFCRVTIPINLLWVEDGWTITVGDQLITDYRIIPDENFTYLYFTYNHSTQTVAIQGTYVIPEFPSFLILLLFMVATLLAVIVYKRKHARKRLKNC